MNHCIRSSLFSTLVVLTTSAWADWANPGAEYFCDKEKRTFTLDATMDTSSPDDFGTVKPYAGYQGVSHSKNRISCKFGTTNIKARISVDGPRASGMCAGYTHLFIDSFLVNGKRAFKPTSFNSSCSSNDPDLYKVTVTEGQAGPMVRLCYATWDWGVGYTLTSCNDIHLANPSLQGTRRQAARP
jgi:hypothetical protein